MGRSTISWSAFVFVWMFAGTVPAAPRFVHVSWSQPDAASTMTVTWMTDSVSDSNIVRYGIDSTDEFEAEGYSFQANGELGVVHVVEISDLDPDTTYLYQVGGPTGGWSGEYAFSTGVGPCQQFKFAALGDNRPDTDWLPQFHWNPVLQETVNDGPHFIVHTGDIVKSGDETGQWNTFLESSEPHMAQYPVMPAIGNHDDGPADGEGANYNQVFSLPVNEVTETEDYYYFTYGNAIFVSLSSQTYTGGDYKFQEQAEWLDQVLTDNPAKWRFVYLHHPPYTSHLTFDLIFTEVEFNHPPNENQQNETLVPIFDKHHVDIVFTGHNHYYERLGPMVQGPDPAEGTPVVSFADGTVYVVTGGGGAFVYDEFDILGIDIDLVDWVCNPGNKAAGSTVCKGDLHYVSVEINDDVLVYEAWSTAEQTLGYNPDNKQLIDTFLITKEPSEECEEPEVPDVVEEASWPEQTGDDLGAADVTTEVDDGDYEVITELDIAPDVAAVEELQGSPDLLEQSDGTGKEIYEVEFTVEPDLSTEKKDGGCGCRFGPGTTASAGPLILVLLGLLLLAVVRRPARHR